MQQTEGSDAYDFHSLFNNSSSFILTWHGLSVWVKKVKCVSFWTRRNQYEYVHILKNVSGIVKSGMLLAIMGASGAGKTTLLATISQRIKGEMEGDIMINGISVDKDFMIKLSGFVPQEDLCIDCLSVTEHLQFMAHLLMGHNRHRSQYIGRINTLLLEMGLEKCRNTQILHISGGEKKRLSLAIQLLTDPHFLFCDEPTTGLDSYNAGVVIEKLRQLAAQGKAVICTIHQPPSGIFELFSHVLFIANGRTAYHGDVLGAKEHFDRLGLLCPPSYNQAEFFVSQLAIIPGYEKISYRKINRLCDEFSSSAYGIELMEQVSITSDKQSFVWPTGCDLKERALSHIHQTEDIYFNQCIKRRKSGILRQFYWLTWRATIEMTRNTSHIFIQFILYIWIALLISLPYTDVKVDQKGIQSLQGLMYLIITETIFTFMYSVTNLFPQEIPILLREVSSGLYHPAPYYLAKILVLIPRCIVGPTFFTGIVFLIARLDGGFFGFVVLSIPVILSSMAATAYGCLMSAAFDSISTATILSAPFDFIGLTFSGIFLQLSTLPPYLSWIRYVSPFYYGTEAVSILQWDQVQNISCCVLTELPCISSGEGVLLQYGYINNHFPIDLVGLITFYCMCHLIAFLAIWQRSKSQPIY